MTFTNELYDLLEAVAVNHINAEVGRDILVFEGSFNYPVIVINQVELNKVLN